VKHSVYDDPDFITAEVANGGHRDVIGGLWEPLGELQLSFLCERGLRPDHRLLDLGCGSLRLGRLAIPFLDAHRYFGLDSNASLIEAGRALELDDAGRQKAPETAFACNPDFDVAFVKQPVDVAIAQSVFTHLPINYLRRCLVQLAPWMKVGGTLYATYFELPDGAVLTEPYSHTPGGIVTHDYRDPYHYRAADLEWAATVGPWRFERLGDWSHPRGQLMAAFHRL
jgi:SAM-dependent methyltransferase